MAQRWGATFSSSNLLITCPPSTHRQNLFLGDSYYSDTPCSLFPALLLSSANLPSVIVMILWESWHVTYTLSNVTMDNFNTHPTS